MNREEPMEQEVVLKMSQICKSFGPVQVLENVDLQLTKGEVLGLIGENGAGKSTLIKILCGIYHATSGEIELNGKKVQIPNAQAAQNLGISTIYQELSIIPDLNAVQNIFLNRELTKGKSLFFPLNYGEMKEINDTTISSLEKARKDKTEKYKELVESVIAQFNIDCKLYIVIVSSLGVIPDKTRNVISKILKCNKRECKKISRRLVYEAIRGSFLVFYNVTSDSNIGRSTVQTDNTIGSLNNEEPDSE